MWAVAPTDVGVTSRAERGANNEHPISMRPRTVISGPLVSIITPAYNAAAFIGETIASALGQTYANWELLVVDDGSTDATCAVVQGFADPRIRIIRAAHSGHPAVVRNI